MLSLHFKTPPGSKYLPFLLDTGAQCSVLNYDLVKHEKKTLTPVEKPLTSLGLNRSVQGYLFDTEITLPCSESQDVQFFCMPFHLRMTVNSIGSTLEKLKDAGVPISTNVPKYHNDSINICGILGNDVLQHFQVFEFKCVLNGKMLRLSNGFIPIGSINSLVIDMNNAKHSCNHKSGLPGASDNIACPVSNQFDSLNDIYDGETLHSDGILNDGSSDDLPSSNINSDLGCKVAPVVKVKKSIFTKRRGNKKVQDKPVKCNDMHVPKNLVKQVNFVLEPKSTYYSPLQQVFPDSLVEQGLEDLYSMESIGIKDNSSLYDDKEMDTFRNSITFKDNKYHIDIPWRRDVLKDVPSNYGLAKVIARKVSCKNGTMDDDYFAVFEEQIKLDIIEEIPEPSDPNKSIWIPHRPIVRTDPLVASTKIRAVYNCSLKVKGSPSLNDAAYPGKDMLNDLFGLVQYFRTNRYTVLADIAKAFLNIRLNKNSDKDCFSFVVFHKGKFHYYRFNTIIFGFISSPFILNYIINYHAGKCTDSTIRDILCNKMYVDNLIYTSNNKDELIDTCENVNNSMGSVGFKLREWNSNNIDILKNFDDSCNTLNDCKVLGYVYHPDNDTISLKNFKLSNSCSTKRDIVSAISSVFDPIGMVSPVLVEAKLFMRKLCQSKFSWDEKLPEELITEWRGYANKLDDAFSNHDMCMQREVANDHDPASLIIFADSSKQSYGFAIYCIQNGKSKLLFSKFKLVPIPTKTLPTLELLAIFLAVKCTLTLVSNVNFHIPVKDITFLTDSQVALSWVLTGRIVKKNIFVSNRIKDMSVFKESFSNMNIDLKFSYIPTEHNMADIVTKPINISKFCAQKDFWMNGPVWLTQPTNNWPTGQLGCLPAPFRKMECDVEIESSPLILPIAENNDNNDEINIINVKDYSSYSKLFSVTMKVFIAVNKFLSKDVVLAELKRSVFVYLFKSMQKECFNCEIEYLSNTPLNYNNAPKVVKDLNLFLDKDGLLRSKGRISKNLTLSYDAVNPVILSDNHHLTDLIIRDSHFSCKHLGVDSTINHLRQTGFWVLHARQCAKRVLKNCILCHKYNSRAFGLPPTPSLPKNRLNLIKPFNHTGVDYTGHFFVKDFSENKHKCYILIFTCMNTRSIHLEIVNSMSVEDFIMAFIRFHNRYGLPQVLYSDNAKSFISSTAVISNLIASDHFQEKFIRYNIAHKTIPAYSPWFGATWERIFKTIKQCLYKTFGRSVVNETNFVTSLSDIQLAINNRPLTYRDKDNSIEVVTPNNLMSSNASFPSLVISEEDLEDNFEEDSIRDKLLNSLETRDVIVNRFRNDWYNKYLLSLRDKHKNSFCIKELHTNPNFLYVGSVVLIKNAVKPRPYWTIGKIVEMLPGEDGLIRVVKVMRPDHNIMTTSIANLYPLELNCNEVPDNESEQISETVEDDSSAHDNYSTESSENATEIAPGNDQRSGETSTRPPRQAALNFKKRLKEWIERESI